MGGQCEVRRGIVPKLVSREPSAIEEPRKLTPKRVRVDLENEPFAVRLFVKVSQQGQDVVLVREHERPLLPVLRGLFALPRHIPPSSNRHDVMREVAVFPAQSKGLAEAHPKADEQRNRAPNVNGNLLAREQ